MLPSVTELIARFLKTNGYEKTLDAFIEEAGLPPDAGTASGTNVTLEQILQEKKTFDISLNFEKLGIDDDSRSWRLPGELSADSQRSTSLISIAPTSAVVLETPTKSNILSVTLQKCLLPSTPRAKEYFAATTADRRLHLFDPSLPSSPAVRSYSSFLDSPILDLVVIDCKYLLAASMSGRLLLYDIETDRVLDEKKHHSKYIVKLSTWSEGTSTLVASAGWDAKVFIYRLEINREDPCLGQPIATMTLSSIPETLLFVQSPDTSCPILLLTRRDSTFLYYYAVPPPEADEPQIMMLGRQNLAPHSNAWVAFSPSDVRVSPVDASLVAVATSSTPHMKLLIVRLLLPPTEAAVIDMIHNPGQISTTQASQARADLLLRDKEEAAIVVNVSTMAPQTAYSTPRLAWRPDGSGVYVSSDDGIVRGFEAITGKHFATLETHEPGSKLRCLWAGHVDADSSCDSRDAYAKEYLLSGGFDQKLVSWSAS